MAGHSDSSKTWRPRILGFGVFTLVIACGSLLFINRERQTRIQAVEFEQSVRAQFHSETGLKPDNFDILEPSFRPPDAIDALFGVSLNRRDIPTNWFVRVQAPFEMSPNAERTHKSDQPDLAEDLGIMHSLKGKNAERYRRDLQQHDETYRLDWQHRGRKFRSLVVQTREAVYLSIREVMP